MSYSQQPAPPGRQPHPFAPPRATEPPEKKRATLKIAVGVVCACIVFGLGAAVGGGKKAEAKLAPTATVTVTAKAAKANADKPKRGAKPAEKPAAPAGPDTTVGQGSYLVGEDMAVGTYRTGGPAASDVSLCYWARAQDSSGDMDSILAHGTPQGPVRVTVSEGETFETNGCKEWTKVR
ncbi:hypothetical protein SLV14_006623 [Streptomyces sp. Je 1-4]|uniref:hypothetical protein n=1 Tax=Streptomyces TaxID=1883 RepID=UPI0021DB628B|nr:MULTISPECIES: hypothetical protein [unclassified Streptomyces]UYB43624.1 hypothetical protein SLV14_006623 [Streptomyces sp. Je 1-4]UZQ40017.1 hypothetical protein SLV14N_006623 [Streptomyces sp. Je 1-4] [Streptomyces sp. Je 1-4 4N24]UZQ47434.1 hypothetical protein SLV14NA_006623 [Streptomyces sp. Je 1-4] [Streptomyces sp. Je 1-4 4N24_ara]